MKKQFFTLCLENARPDQFNDGTTTVSLKGRYNNYEINFFGSSVDDYELNVEDFGKMKGKEWIQMEPTPTQLEQMNDFLQKHVDMAFDTESDRNDHNAQMRRQYQDELTYGRPDTLCNSFY